MAKWDFQYVVDRMKLSDMVLTYMRGLDTRDFHCLESVLTRPTFHMQMIPLEIDRELTPREYWEQGPIFFLDGFDFTSHISSNHMVEIDGDEACVDTRLYACHYIKACDLKSFMNVENIPLSYHPSQFIGAHFQMLWTAWARRQKDGDWLFYRVRMSVEAADGTDQAFSTSLKRSGAL